MKGEFENRLRQVIEEVQASPKPIILFIDEAHTLIGAGGAAGTGDAANLLKPALARGKLRTIAATTWAEYKKYIEKDPALTRRFQVVQVDEPSEDKAIVHDARRGLARWRSITRCSPRRGDRGRVKLSHRYIPAASSPTSRSACSTPPARASRSARCAMPAAVEDSRGKIEALEIELASSAARRRPAGKPPSGRPRRRRSSNGARPRGELEKRWKSEQELVAQYRCELRRGGAEGR